ncbi:hypothetical protein Q428_14135 [Fervidicella metallireducens AeB]|uniref:[NiFe] hydrogenase small subunit HydA n=1 Tax=Fervidicella metallireducens AeB TaxID=1403537 RepID=A0A017RR94_9CLOT|nr:hydrogenase small subunit [Fervidicella metallireducens]EYE87288.1 hypothetical protein Q428_14135 [Fervidicella metallireducens AeB]
MKMSRRDFLKWCTASAVALGITSVDLNKLEEIVLAAETAPNIIWLQGSGCSGCSISMLNAVENTTIDNFLINKVNMKYHHNLMAAAGALAISALDLAVLENKGNFILVIEGAIPTYNNGTHCILTERNGQPWTMLSAVKELAANAKYVIAAGTCSAYGGVPKAGINITGIKTVKEVAYGMTMNPIINLPGCPVHPLTLTKTIIDLYLYGMPKIDSEGRPTEFYSSSVHQKCPRRGTSSASVLGAPGCYKNCGCKGPQTNNNCPSRKWNNGVNWCIDGGHQCIGCGGKDFPQTPIYKFL